MFQSSVSKQSVNVHRPQHPALRHSPELHPHPWWQSTKIGVFTGLSPNLPPAVCKIPPARLSLWLGPRSEQQLRGHLYHMVTGRRTHTLPTSAPGSGTHHSTRALGRVAHVPKRWGSCSTGLSMAPSETKLRQQGPGQGCVNRGARALSLVCALAPLSALSSLSIAPGTGSG